ncbi:ras guanine nucleotide exchange factor domain-containing protein [Mycena maculata]|uniref:Ras guanine nucleotide exchange factor domain-containing protein n=1 Tax=Mycena maculata TaxID=230809 RepID=A0AAD7HBT0_9AGAR|nr:ras guanine nucleotide exchange factor domain-containing protein [Mycena maculata]
MGFERERERERELQREREIQIDPDGSVRSGTVPALVERLTTHEQGDPTFIKAFLMTFKSFTTVDDLFNLLVQRFWIRPPPKLTTTEREEWGKLKQHVIRIRVLNTFKSMVVDDDVLEKDDLFVLDRLKEFITADEVSKFPAAKQLLMLIERAQKGGDSMIKMVTAPQGVPPPPIVPKSSKKLKLLDIEPLELARQLTIMESQLYQRVRPMECLQRASEQRTENIDNIAVIIQTSNKIALWAVESVLSKEDSWRRAAAVKHLINVADQCRVLNNFSTMAAITAGLNTPPIRRLEQTWEQVNQGSMVQFGACETIIDSNKNFIKYRAMMTSVIPPCVPFIAIFLLTLQFIQDSNPDNLQGSLVNFRKWQMASEVINDIKRWQAPFNFHTIPSIQAYIEESLNAISDTQDSSERLWNISLEREPRERAMGLFVATPTTPETPPIKQPPRERKNSENQTHPPNESKKSSDKSHRDRIIPPDEDMRRLFQECKIGVRRANLLSEALAATPEELKTPAISVRVR